MHFMSKILRVFKKTCRSLHPQNVKFSIILKKGEHISLFVFIYHLQKTYNFFYKKNHYSSVNFQNIWKRVDHYILQIWDWPNLRKNCSFIFWIFSILIPKKNYGFKSKFMSEIRSILFFLETCRSLHRTNKVMSTTLDKNCIEISNFF